MIIRRTNPMGDWEFGKGVQSYATKELAIEQNIQSRIRSWLGNCFFSLLDGIDWKNLSGKLTKDALDLSIRATILKSYGVVRITSYTSLLNSDRTLTITYSVDTIYGTYFNGVINQGVTG